MQSITSLLENIGHAMPDRERIQGTTNHLVKIQPTEVPIIPCRDDTFIITGTDLKKNNLKGKKVVVIFGRESHYLTTSFFIPKLSMIYLNLTERRNDIEFVFVSLDEKEDQYNRSTASHPWYCVPWKDEADTRLALIGLFHDRLNNKNKNKNGIGSVTIIDSDDERTIINPDAEDYISKTHNTVGDDFPWKYSAAANACAGLATLAFCTIM